MMTDNHKPFPIPVITTGPGSQGEETPDYLAMPQGMHTFAAPRLPENVSAATLHETARLLSYFLDGAAATGLRGGAKLDLIGLDTALRDVINQSMGFGEVSAFTVGSPQWRVQETAFAGIWRILGLNAHGQIECDRLEVAPIPGVLAQCMQNTSQNDLAAPAYPAGVMNAPALVEEIRLAAADFQPDQAAHTINLTLLPVSEADLDTLYQWLGHHTVSLLSRGYGNCRITSTHLKNVWWVQYFNSMDTLILNSIEIVAMPEVALAAEEDFADSVERLREYIAAMAETEAA